MSLTKKPKRTGWPELLGVIFWVAFILICYRFFSRPHPLEIPGTAVAINTPPTHIEILSLNGLEIRKAPHTGGYKTSGTVNGIPVTFIVDTGATYTALPAAVAQRAGIPCEKQIQSSTANGVITECHGHAANLTFGPFHLTNVLVGTMSNGSDALLGLNVLQHFTTTTGGNVLRIGIAGQTTFEEASDPAASEAQPTFTEQQRPTYQPPTVAAEESPQPYVPPATAYPTTPHKSLKECMGSSNTVNDEVLACMNRR